VEVKKVIKSLFLTPLIIIFVLFEIFVVCLYGVSLYLYLTEYNPDVQQQTTKFVSEEGQNK
jgi:hypothetical protein